MASTYQTFLNAPSTGALAADASINYITTTTTINEPAAILKHLKAQQTQVIKKQEKILNAIESANGLCLETETTLQFRVGGGAYLPGIDENLLDEREVTLPIVHIVGFDGNGKISQIRLYWEQGTMLRQVDAVGRTGRNWPIRDGKNLVEAVKYSVQLQAGGKSGSSSSSSNSNSNSNGSAAEARPRNQSDVVVDQHKRGDSVSATRDPHASLALFAPRDPNAEGRSYEGPGVTTRESAKPAPRDYGELFTGEETPAASSRRSSSPSKVDGRSVKAGAGKNVSANRLFDENTPLDPGKSKKVFDNKYDHFSFGNGEDAPQDHRPISGKGGSKSNSHFSFEDFHTPPKVTEKHRPDYERHWGAGVDEVASHASGTDTDDMLTTSQDDPPTQPKRPIVHAARKDADTHYEIADDSPAHIPIRPLNPAAHVDAARRGQDFRSHYDSPNAADEDAHARPRDDMGKNWSYADSPVKSTQIYKTAGDGMGGRKVKGEEVLAETQKKIYKTAGDGMGGRKGSGRLWGFGDDSDPEVEKDVRASARSRRAQAGGGADY